MRKLSDVTPLPAPGTLLFEADWYLDTYRDVRDAGLDPLTHFLLHGALEGRQPNPLFYTDWYAEQHLKAGDTTDPFRHYIHVGQHLGLRFNPIDDPRFISEEYGLRPDENPLAFLLNHGEVNRVSAWFSRKAYLEFNPDVAAAGVIPEVHFLAFGLQEKRLCGPHYTVVSSPVGGRTPASQCDPEERTAQEFAWAGQIHRVKTSLLSPLVVRQIRAQARIDPDVAAAGINAVASLRQYKATDIDARISVDYQQLLDEVPLGQDVVILLPSLRIGGAEKYGADLASGLKTLGLRTVLVVTTDGTKPADTQALTHEIFAPLRDNHVASVGDFLGQGEVHETVLAHLLLRAGPRHLFVINSDLGLRAVRRHGRALSSRMRIAAAFFSESPFAMGAPYSARYLRDILPYSDVLSDNRATLDKLVARVGPTAAERFHCLPPTVSLMDSRSFQRDLAARAPRHGRQIRALWLSRWEPFKAVDVLMRLAELEPTCTIDAFGPGGSTGLGAGIPLNIKLMGPVSGPSSLSVGDYDVFLFTSYFEGMPNVVLEMAGAGIPIVASDVGGLRETFSGDAVEFVDMGSSVGEAATAFQTALARITDESDTAQMARLKKARQQVERRHSPEVFLSELARFIERAS